MLDDQGGTFSSCKIQPLSEARAREIITWRYDPPYDLYNLKQEDLPLLLDPGHSYHQVINSAGELIGFCCFGEDARIPGGIYPQEEPQGIDVGLGLRPSLTGQGSGPAFAAVVLKFAVGRYQPEIFRVSVASFNIRSWRTFLKLGFQEEHRVRHKQTGQEFIQLICSVEGVNYDRLSRSGS